MNQKSNHSQQHAQTVQTTKITPELVQQVTDKVYAIWFRDLQIQNERKRLHRSK